MTEYGLPNRNGVRDHRDTDLAYFLEEGLIAYLKHNRDVPPEQLLRGIALLLVALSETIGKFQLIITKKGGRGTLTKEDCKANNMEQIEGSPFIRPMFNRIGFNTAELAKLEERISEVVGHAYPEWIVDAYYGYGDEQEDSK